MAQTFPAAGFADKFLKRFRAWLQHSGSKRCEGNAMSYTINHTMMRIDLPTPLKAGASMSFNIKWFYNINNYQKEGGLDMSFRKDGNKICNRSVLPKNGSL
jgi:hypothetical protein